MPTPIGELFVRIGADTKDLNAKLDAVQKKTAKVFAGVAAGVAAIGAVGASFESSMARVGANVGAAGDELKKMSKVARKVAAETKFSATEAADGMVFFSMAGFSAEQTMAALAPTAKLASAGFLNLSDSADIVTNIMSGMGIGFDQLENSIDVLVKAATSANTSVQQLGVAFSYAGPFLKDFGISMEEGAAAIGLLSNAGIQAERAGTALRGVIQNLAKPTSTAAAMLQQLKVSVRDVNNNMLPLDVIFKQFAESGATATQMLHIFDTRTAAAANVLTESMRPSLDGTKKTLASFTEELKNAGGTTNEIMDKLSQTVGFQFGVLRSNIEEVALVLYEDFRPAIMAALKIGQGLAMTVAQLNPGFRKLITNGALLVGVAAGLTAAIATLGKVFLVAFAPMNLVVMGIVAAVMILVGAIGLVVDNWEAVGPVLKTIGTSALNMIKAIALAVLQLPEKFSVFLSEIWGLFLKVVVAAIAGAMELVGIPGQEFYDSWAKGIDNSINAIKSFFKKLNKWVSTAAKFWGKALGGLFGMDSKEPPAPPKDQAPKDQEPKARSEAKVPGATEVLLNSALSGFRKIGEALGLNFENMSAEVKAFGEEIGKVTEKMTKPPETADIDNEERKKRYVTESALWQRLHKVRQEHLKNVGEYRNGMAEHIAKEEEIRQRQLAQHEQNMAAGKIAVDGFHS
jgi:TP901 family phage tail tape measure protein